MSNYYVILQKQGFVTEVKEWTETNAKTHTQYNRNDI
jgi:hypothetical protein